jgi:beta-N-acetylhexosaminidase
MESIAMPLGAAMVDLAGTELTAAERERLMHPAVGGVILFARNYATPRQLKALTAEVAGLRDPPLLIAVDQEGGRVQRFRSGFTALPPPRSIGAAFDEDPERGLEGAYGAGLVMAQELREHGVTLSFAPVFDIDFGRSSVIGDRALHSDPRVVAQLCLRMMEGMRAAGVAGVGKHFPGHGYARADSHHEIPIDERTMSALRCADLVPYVEAIAHGLGAIMPAHVVFPALDSHPAGFSSFWLREVLRGELGFRGVIFSDDLTMEGASVAGSMPDRAKAAFSAGCDMVLICNAPELADAYLTEAEPHILAPERAQLMGAGAMGAPADRVKALYLDARRALARV